MLKDAPQGKGNRTRPHPREQKHLTTGPVRIEGTILAVVGELLQDSCRLPLVFSMSSQIYSADPLAELEIQVVAAPPRLL